MKSKVVIRKSMLIRPSGRSTDFITPSFVNECAYNCTYCYVKRHNAEFITIAENVGQILSEVNNHAFFTNIDKPNQTHPEFITYDIGCNTDVSLHAKQINWEYIFKFFKDHPIAMGSFATKYVNKILLLFNPQQKIRIRFSLMPEVIRKQLEPNTSTIEQRLNAVQEFQLAGYEVHLNFSPVVVYENWLDDYKQLFEQVLDIATLHNWNNSSVKAEVIFLTHNENKHLYNVGNNLSGEHLLWTPHNQERKQSQYGGSNIRYNHIQKREYIKDFVNLHDNIIPWNTIRYIF